MADLYGEGESRGAPIPTFPLGWAINKLRRDPAPPEPVPEGPLLEERPQALSDIFWEGAQRGSLGGTVGGAGTRAVHGGSGAWSDPLAADRGTLGAAFASDNPYVAATYAGPKGKVYPFRINPDELTEIRHGGWTEKMVRPTDNVWQDTTHLWKPAPEGPVSALDYRDVAFPNRRIVHAPKSFPRLQDNQREWPAGFSTDARSLPPGHAQVVRNVVDVGKYRSGQPDTGLSGQWDKADLWSAPSEQWAYGPGTAVESAGPALTTGELAALQAQSLESGRLANPNRHPLAYEMDAERLINTVRDDPRFAPGEGRLLFRGLDPSRTSLADKAGAFLRAGGVKKMLKSALSPANLLLDATLGAGVGGLSSAAGYWAGQPDIQHGYTFPEGSLIQAELDKPDLYTGRVATPPYTESEVRRATVRADLEKERRR